MVIVDQVCPVRTRCRNAEADELVMAVEAGGSTVVRETSGIHGVLPRAPSLGSGVLSYNLRRASPSVRKDSTEQVFDQYRRLVSQSAISLTE